MRPITKHTGILVGLVLLTTNGAVAETIASVDGSDITAAQLNAFAEGRTGQAPTDQNRADLIAQLTDLFVLSNEAVKKGYDKNDDVAAQLELQRRSILAQAVVKAWVDNNTASEEQVRAEYDKQFGDAAARSQYKARHILVETPEAATAVIDALKGGADFAELAKEQSTGPSGSKGGDLGWFDADAMVPEFSAAVIALEDGQFSNTPVQTQFGWHVILREETRSAEPPAYDDVKAQIRQVLDQRSFQEYFDSLRAAAETQ